MGTWWLRLSKSQFYFAWQVFGLLSDVESWVRIDFYFLDSSMIFQLKFLVDVMTEQAWVDCE